MVNNRAARSYPYADSSPLTTSIESSRKVSTSFRFCKMTAASLQRPGSTSCTQASKHDTRIHVSHVRRVYRTPTSSAVCYARCRMHRVSVGTRYRFMWASSFVFSRTSCRRPAASSSASTIFLRSVCAARRRQPVKLRPDHVKRRGITMGQHHVLL